MENHYKIGQKFEDSYGDEVEIVDIRDDVIEYTVNENEAFGECRAADFQREVICNGE